MKYIASGFMCFLLCLATAQAQNLVPNGSFEEGDPCPSTYAAINELDHWYFGIQLPDMDWNFWPSPDWWHTCSPFEPLQPPNVAAGYQEPLSGGGMAGILTSLNNIANHREVLSIQLSEALEVGETYTFMMSAVRAVSQGIGGASNRLGVKLTTFPYWITEEGPVDNMAHFSIEEALEDTTNWHTYIHEIIADSSYLYLHLGNFYDDSQTTIINYDYVVVLRPYYFLDDISLIKASISSTDRTNVTTSLRIFPNPVSQTLNLECSQGITNIQMISLSGQVIFEKKLYRDEHYELNTSAWSSGVYLLKAIDGEGAVHHSKLIKN
jgi:hypothetical protein